MPWVNTGNKELGYLALSSVHTMSQETLYVHTHSFSLVPWKTLVLNLSYDAMIQY